MKSLKDTFAVANSLNCYSAVSKLFSQYRKISEGATLRLRKRFSPPENIRKPKFVLKTFERNRAVPKKMKSLNASIVFGTINSATSSGLKGKPTKSNCNTQLLVNSERQLGIASKILSREQFQSRLF